ncbi:MAG: hypothetical protein ABJE10_05625 [bacterium]
MTMNARRLLAIVACIGAPSRMLDAQPATAVSIAVAPPTCAMGAADSTWLIRALANWRVVEREILRLSPTALPTIVTFDARCAFVAKARAEGKLVWRGAIHGGRIILPDGKVIPPNVTSFAAPADSGNGGFFVMSLPSVWRAQGVKSGLGVEGLMDVVLLHELMHTRQFYYANPKLAELTRRYNLSADMSDDDLQHAFEKNAAYVADYAKERDLLFASAAATDARESKRLACEALSTLRARRTRWFTGNSAQWAPLDEIFLTMEGLGQWTAYAWLVGDRGPHLKAAVAQREIRRGGKHWTQDEGLALFLVIDRHVKNWQTLAFAQEPLTAEALLARACM